MKISFLGCLEGGFHTVRWAFFISSCVLFLNFHLDNIEVVQLNFGGLQARNLEQSPLTIFIIPPAKKFGLPILVRNLHYSQSPTNHTSTWQEHYIKMPKSLFLRHLAIRVTILSVSKLSTDAYSLWNKVKQTSRPQVILKIQPPICLDYRVCNRATELHERGTCEKGWCVIHWSSRKAKPQSTGCSKARST